MTTELTEDDLPTPGDHQTNSKELAIMTTPPAHTSRNTAVEQIAQTIEAGGAAHRTDYDLQAIADQVLGDRSTGYQVTVTEPVFWQIVEANQTD